MNLPFVQTFPAVIVLGVACLAGAAVVQEGPALKLSAEERAILDWTNQVRAKEKLPELKPHPQLLTAARSHSANMARQQKMDHELDGKGPAQRVEEAGYDYAEVSENIAWGGGPVTAFYQLWLDSPPHRKNIVNDRSQDIGIGVARDDKGQLYATVVFGLQRKKQ